MNADNGPFIGSILIMAPAAIILIWNFIARRRADYHARITKKVK